VDLLVKNPTALLWGSLLTHGLASFLCGYFEDRLKLDEYYVRNWSLWMDFVILLKTVRVVWRGEGV